MESQRHLCLVLTVIVIYCGLTLGQNSRPNIVIVLADDLVSIIRLHCKHCNSARCGCCYRCCDVV